MEAQHEDPAEEIKRLQRCMNDLVSLLALPAMWSGGDPIQIVHTLLDVLEGILRLDLVYVRLKDSHTEAPVEIVRIAQLRNPAMAPQEIGELLGRSLGDDPQKWPPRVRSRIGDDDYSIVPLRLGTQGDMGVIIVGSQRADFPGQTEKLLLSVAVNQAAIALQEARHRSDQKRVADELDQRVAQRTRELAAANEELKRAEQKIRLIIDTALDAVITMDAQGSITSWNKQAEIIFGWTHREAIGQRMSDVIIPEGQRAAHERGLRHFLATGDGPILNRRIEVIALRRGGVEFPAELEVLPMKVGSDWAFSAFLRDITDSKLAQEKLLESELNLRRMTETIPEMLWSATPEGAIEYCNDRVLDYTGFQASEIMGDGWKKLLHPDDADQAIRSWMLSVATGAPYRTEVRIFHAADRTYRWCVTSALPLLDSQRRILKWYGTVVDMHDWKQAQEELRDTQTKLAHMTRVMSMGELTASIAHEVNQPLSGIVTNASTCLRMLAADPPNVEGARETARRTIRDGNRAADVITRLRALFSKKAATTERVDLNEAAQEVIALALSDLQKSRVVLQRELADDLPLVTCDRVQLQQVILNLLRNASDAMSGVDDRPRQLIIRTNRENNDRVRLTVQDSGAGFAPQDAERLFDAFYTTKNGGMGIGLAVSRNIIESHGGQLLAAPNKDGPGSVFAFYIPCTPDRVTDAHSLDAIQVAVFTDPRHIERNP